MNESPESNITLSLACDKCRKPLDADQIDYLQRGGRENVSLSDGSDTDESLTVCRGCRRSFGTLKAMQDQVVAHVKGEFQGPLEKILDQWQQAGFKVERKS